EGRAKGEEEIERGQVGATQHTQVGAAAGPRPEHQVGLAVAIDVLRCYSHPADELRGVCEEAVQRHVAHAIEHLDVAPPPARPRSGDEVGQAVAVDVTGRHDD